MALQTTEKTWVLLHMLFLAAAVSASERVAHQFWSQHPIHSFRTHAVETLEQGNVDTIFIGSSHIYTGIDPAEFDQNVVNISDSALSYELAEVLCDRYWDTVRTAQTVIIELDAVPVYMDTLERRNGDFREFHQWKLSTKHLPLAPLTKLTSWISEHFTVCRRKRLWPGICGIHDKKQRITGPGFEARQGPLKEKDREVFFAAMGKEFSEDRVTRNIQSLLGLTKRLQDEGVEVKLYRPPFHTDYWSHPSSEARSKYSNRALTALKDRFGESEIEVLDFRYKFNSADNQADLFADWVHVSHEGARRASSELSTILTSHQHND